MKLSRANKQPGGRTDDTCVTVSGQSLTLACPFISEQFVAFLAAAFEGAHRVPAEVIAAAVVLQAFVDVCVKVKVVIEREVTKVRRERSDVHTTSSRLVEN